MDTMCNYADSHESGANVRPSQRVPTSLGDPAREQTCDRQLRHIPHNELTGGQFLITLCHNVVCITTVARAASSIRRSRDCRTSEAIRAGQRL